MASKHSEISSRIKKYNFISFKKWRYIFDAIRFKWIRPRKPLAGQISRYSRGLYSQPQLVERQFSFSLLRNCWTRSHFVENFVDNLTLQQTQVNYNQQLNVACLAQSVRAAQALPTPERVPSRPTHSCCVLLALHSLGDVLT